MHVCILISMYSCICLHARDVGCIQNFCKYIPTLMLGKIKCKLTCCKPSPQPFPWDCCCAFHVFFYVCVDRQIRSDFWGWLESSSCRFSRFRPHSWSQRRLAARKRCKRLRFGSQRQLCHVLGLWSDAHHRPILRDSKMKARDKSRASCKQKTAASDRSREIK